MVDVRAKKDMMSVQAPAGPSDVCLPFAGNVAMACPKNSRFLTNIFGIQYYVQPRADALSSDIVIAAWSARTVTKACDCYFNSMTVERRFLVLRERVPEDGVDANTEAENINLRGVQHLKFFLAPDSESTKATDTARSLHLQELQEACEGEGGLARISSKPFDPSMSACLRDLCLRKCCVHQWPMFSAAFSEPAPHVLLVALRCAC